MNVAASSGRDVEFANSFNSSNAFISALPKSNICLFSNNTPYIDFWQGAIQDIVKVYKIMVFKLNTLY